MEFTLREVARIVGRHERTVIYHLQKGHIKPIRKKDGYNRNRIYFDIKEIEKLKQYLRKDR